MTPKTTDRSRDDLRQDLIDSSADLLSDHGIDGFSLNRAADGANTSKQMIYTIFGGKADLVKAVYDHKVSGFVDELRAIKKDDPVERLLSYALAYRDYILEHDALFDIMYSLSFAQNFRDRRERVIERNDIFGYYDEAVRECINEGYLDESVDVESLTDSLWASANGCIRLELVDYYEDSETAKQHYVDTTAGVLWGRGTVLPNMEDGDRN